jgi:hypothetical protein
VTEIYILMDIFFSFSSLSTVCCKSHLPTPRFPLLSVPVRPPAL